MLDNNIKDTDELEFAIFCIENTAIRLGKTGEEVYKLLAEESDILNSYIVLCFDLLHTQSKDYIIDDILSVMEERGIQI